MLIILIFLVLASSGVYLYQQSQIPTPQSTKITELSPSPAETITTTKSVSTPKSTTSPTQQVNSRVKLSSASPAGGNSGEEIKLLGTGFGTITGKVYFFNQIMGPTTPFMDVTPSRWTDTELKITIPPAVGGQNIDIEVWHKDGTKSNRIKFTINGGQPRIDNFSPSNAQPLQSLTMSGKEFGDQAGKVNIYNLDNYELSSPNASCQINSWSNNTIKCTLPSTVNNGTEYGFMVESSDGRKSSFQFYKVGN